MNTRALTSITHTPKDIHSHVHMNKYKHTHTHTQREGEMFKSLTNFEVLLSSTENHKRSLSLSSLFSLPPSSSSSLSPLDPARQEEFKVLF